MKVIMKPAPIGSVVDGIDPWRSCRWPKPAGDPQGRFFVAEDCNKPLNLRMVRRMAMARHRFAGLVGTDDDEGPPKSAPITGETLSVRGGVSMA